MSFTERCQQEQRQVELFSSQREGTDALFMQIWAVLDPEPRSLAGP
jgi:hypothetical protein